MKQVTQWLTGCAMALSLAAFGGEGGTVKGKVTFDGAAPEAKVIKIDPAKAAGCHHGEQPDDSLIVDKATKGIQNVVIRLVADSYPELAAPPAVVIDQKGCKYSPRVVIVAPGSSVDVLNPDAIAHTVKLQGREDLDNQANKAMPGNMAKMTVPKKHFTNPDLVELACVPHPWMKGLIVVHDPRYATLTKADGTFEIKNVPAGKYKILIDHEVLAPAYPEADKAPVLEVKDGATVEHAEVKLKP